MRDHQSIRKDKMIKFKQICAENSVIYALDENGQLWIWSPHGVNAGWGIVEMPELPKE